MALCQAPDPPGWRSCFAVTVQTDWLKRTTLSIPSGSLYAPCCRQSIWLFSTRRAVAHHEMELRYSPISRIRLLRFTESFLYLSFFPPLSSVQLSQRLIVCVSLRACISVCVSVNWVYCMRVCVRTCLFRSLLWNKLHSGWGAKWLISGTQIKIQLLQFEATQEKHGKLTTSVCASTSPRPTC